MTLQKWTAGEIFFYSNDIYENPFMDVDLSVSFTNEAGETLVRPAFWCGENKWCVRFAPNALGLLVQYRPLFLWSHIMSRSMDKLPGLSIWQRYSRWLWPVNL